MKAILYDVPRGTMDETSSLWTLVSIALPRSVRESERLFLLIPCWESQRLIPKRSAGPRATKIGVVSLKALDHHRPNRGLCSGGYEDRLVAGRIIRSATNARHNIPNGKRGNAAIRSANTDAHPKELWRSLTRRSRRESTLSKTEHHDV